MENNKEKLFVDVESINTSIRHVLLIGHLLDVMKYASEENARIEEVGINIESLGQIEEKLWDGIKLIVGMPLKEELGVFVDDKWFSHAFNYVDGKISKEEAISLIVDWRNEFSKDN